MDFVPKSIFDKNDDEWKFKAFHKGYELGLEYTWSKTDHQHGIHANPKNLEKIDHNRKGRPEPVSKIIQQGKYECGPAALAMILNESLFNVKRAIGKIGWRNDDSGCTTEHIIGAARLLGRDIVIIDREHYSACLNESLGSCLITIPSLNYDGKYHGIAWNGKEMLDPNWGYEGRKIWGTEWAPWTIKPVEVLELLNCTLSEEERLQQDWEIKKRREFRMKARRDRK